LKLPLNLRRLSILVALAALAFPARAVVLEDFEAGSTGWTTQMGGGTLTDGRISQDFASSGKSSYRGKFNFTSPKGGRASFGTPQAGDFTGLTSVQFDLYNSSPLTFTGTVIMKTGADWKWNESAKFTVVPGWNKDLTIHAAAAGVSPGAAPAAPGMTVIGLKEVGEFSLLLDASTAGSGYLYLDNIRLEGVDPSKLVILKPEDAVSGTEVLLDGFENGGTVFKPETYSGSSAVGVESVTLKTTQGSEAGKFSYQSPSPDEKAPFTVEADLDLTQTTGLKVDVYNPLQSDADLEVAFSTGSNWTYFESLPQTLQPGWNLNVTFPFRTPTFKSEASHWRNTVRPDLKQVRKLSLVVLPHSIGAGFMIMDNVRLVTPNPKAIGTTLKDTLPSGYLAAGHDDLLEGFEGPTAWAAASGWSGAVTTAEVEAQTTQGKKVLKGDFDLSPGNKAAYFGFEGDLDLTGAQEVKVDIYDPVKGPLDASVALNVGSTYDWLESSSVPLKEGWNRDVSLTLVGKSFKSAKANWHYTAKLDSPSKVKKFFVGLYSKEPLKGSVFIDNVRLNRVAGVSGALSVKVKKQKPVTGREVVFDPLMSAAGGWQADQLAADDSYAESVFYGKKNGQSGVELKYSTATQPQKASFYKSGSFDWSNVSGFRFDLFNPQDHSVEVSLALQTGPDFVWHESERVKLVPGWNHDVTVQVDGPTWKTVDSNWTNSDTLKNANDLRQVNLLVYPGNPEKGEVFLSRVRTVERDLLGSLGNPQLGKFLGISSKTTLTANGVQSKTFDGFEAGDQTSAPAHYSGVYTTEGDRSWATPFNLYGNQQLLDLTEIMPAAYKDLRPYQALRFDFYNPGPPRPLTVGFKNTTTNVWISSSAPLSLVSGWNRDITLPLDGPVFKSSITGWKPGSTLTIRDHVDELHFQVGGPPGHGTLNVDNLRVVGHGSTVQIHAMASEDLQVKFNPSDAVQVLVGGTTWKNDLSQLQGEVNRAQVDLRGYHQEIRASVGTALPSTDDPLKLIDGSVMGTGVMALSDRATVNGTSVQLMGFARAAGRPFSLGSDSGYVARVTQNLFEDYTLGAGVIGHRFGAVQGSDPLSAPVESDIKTFMVDAKGYLKKANLTFEGEGARSSYNEYLGASYGLPDPHNKAYHLAATWSGGPFKASAGRDGKELGFFSPYSTSPSNGYYQNHGEMDLQMDVLPGIKDLKRKGGFLGDLLENLKTYGQYYDWHVQSSTYKNYGYRHVLETNDYKTPLYIMAWWYWFNEGKDGGDPSLDNPLLGTHQPQYTWNVSVRYRLTPSLYLNVLGRQSSTHDWESDTAAGGFKYKFWGDTWLSAEAKSTKFSGSQTGSFTNYNAEFIKRLGGNDLELHLTYGTPSFTGYWMDDANLKTMNEWTSTVTVRF